MIIFKNTQLQATILINFYGTKQHNPITTSELSEQLKQNVGFKIIRTPQTTSEKQSTIRNTATITNNY